MVEKRLTQPDLDAPNPRPAKRLRPGSVTIRPRLPDDPPHLRRIERASFQSEPWQEADFLKFDCLVAVHRPPGRATGLIVVGFLVSHEIFSSPSKELAEREILNIAVDPEFRQNGIARALLAAELERGGTHFLEVRESNAAARRLYEMQGFETIGRRKEYYNHPRETAMLMRHSPVVKPMR